MAGLTDDELVDVDGRLADLGLLHRAQGQHAAAAVVDVVVESDRVALGGADYRFYSGSDCSFYSGSYSDTFGIAYGGSNPIAYGGSNAVPNVWRFLVCCWERMCCWDRYGSRRESSRVSHEKCLRCCVCRKRWLYLI